MSYENRQPKITLVGAGPGDAELITLKGINALGDADVVLYDALVNEELLKYAPMNSKKVFVGKRDGQHSYTQEQINTLLVDYAYTHGHVVRLKGGDPFVFGRGIEEIEFAESFNIPVGWIPGISSSIGVPASQGIPVTHRGISESFWVITGRNSETRPDGTVGQGKVPEDVKLAAKSEATVVILMGLKKLPEIIKIYQSFGRGNLPVAVIQDGTLPSEKIAIGSIDTIVHAVEAENIGAPAVIVIGEVVRKNPQAAYLLSLEDHLLQS
ncbi:MAG: uroporphyrinogen-III C-methyltransferase [Bacteroidetes bacterium]|nr:uroporphyrinogen-III C-methyltransferase [Bacteroidota bacterium]